MPYDGELICGNSQVREYVNNARLDVPFTEEELARAEYLREVFSSFTDPGEDWCRYDLMDKNDKVFTSRTVQGF